MNILGINANHMGVGGTVDVEIAPSEFSDAEAIREALRDSPALMEMAGLPRVAEALHRSLSAKPVEIDADQLSFTGSEGFRVNVAVRSISPREPGA